MPNKYERIPAQPQGDPNSDDLRKVDGYVEAHIGNTPTKYASEEYKNCPPLNLATGIQRLMAKDHKALYGEFPKGYTAEFDANYAETIFSVYQEEMIYVPAEYGTVPGADLQVYFDVGVNRHYELIRDELLAKSEEQNVAVTFLKIAERFIETFDIPSWEAVRYTTRLIRKYIPHLSEKARQILLERPIDKRIATRKVFLDFLQSDLLADLFESFQDEVSKGAKFPQAFNYLVKENGSISDIDNGTLELYEEDFDHLKTAYHLAERPYTKEELLLGQEILDTDPHLKASLVIFHHQLMTFIADYLMKHPERLAHSVEHLTEIFLTAEDDKGNIMLIPNPKLLKVISRNVLPAIARSYLENSATNLSSEQIIEGAEIAKRLLLFQTFIGEFHASSDENGHVHLSSFISQTCPAMQPFSKALVEVLPLIYDNCKEKQITLKGLGL